MPKPPRPERDYFGKLDATKKKKIAEEKREKMAYEERKKLRELHWRKCPECGMEMESTIFKGATIFKCFNCGGAFLHAETLKKLCGEDSKIIESILDIFKFK